MSDDEMRAEYDMRGGVRGKYYRSYTANPARIRITEVSSSVPVQFTPQPDEPMSLRRRIVEYLRVLYR